MLHIVGRARTTWVRTLFRMSTSSSSMAQPPRASASLIVVNKHNEILLVQRNPAARSFGGMHVFPGGNFDKTQDQSLAMTAIRETFEESGLLLASSTSVTTSLSSLSDSLLDEARHAIHQQKLNFQTFLTSHDLKADLGSLLPFTEWITPVGPPRRFHTRFYVAFLPASPSSGFSSGAKEDRIPKPDGGREVIAARFLHPVEALNEFRKGKISFMPPQFYIMSTLADILQGSANTREQRACVEALSGGLFGRMVINPLRLREDEDGRTILTYEGDESRGGPNGRLHRAFIKIGKAGAANEMSLVRNFDIFSEIDAQAHNISPKL